MNKILRKINEKFFDIQIKHSFRINKKAPKICMWCNKNLLNEPRSSYGIWVDGYNNTYYECNDCKNKLHKEKEEMLNKYCIYRQWHNNENALIEVCISCTDNAICEYRLKILEKELQKYLPISTIKRIEIRMEK